MTDTSICLKQLENAKNEIVKTEKLIKQMNDETIQKEADYNKAIANYNEKEKLYKTALTTLINYAKTSQDVELNPPVPPPIHDGQCENACFQVTGEYLRDNDYSTYFNKDDVHSTVVQGTKSYYDYCSCKVPNRDTYNSLKKIWKLQNR